MDDELKLLGFWASPYAHKVIWGLKIKGIKYEYIEEDLANKSELLLQSNPIHKKVPVLIHKGKPIPDSNIILEYIEDIHPNNPLFPSDPYERASARFWISFAAEKGPLFYAFYLTSEENRAKTSKSVFEVLKILEDEALKDKKFFGGDNINIVDLTYGWLSHWLHTLEECAGVKVLEPNTLPRLYEWTQNFKKIPIIKDHLPDLDKLVAHMKRLKPIIMAKLGANS